VAQGSVTADAAVRVESRPELLKGGKRTFSDGRIHKSPSFPFPIVFVTVSVATAAWMTLRFFRADRPIAKRLSEHCRWVR